MIISFVDDLLLGGKSEKMRKAIEDLLNAKYIVKCLGQLSLFVGIGVEWGT